MKQVSMKVYITASTTDEINHIVPHHIFFTQEGAKRWVLRRANAWSTGYGKWQILDDDKTILKLETRLNRNKEYVIWFVVEYHIGATFHRSICDVFQELIDDGDITPATLEEAEQIEEEFVPATVEEAEQVYEV